MEASQKITQNKIEVELISFAEFNQLSNLDKAYAKNQEELHEFIKYSPELSSIEQVIQDKSKQIIDRNLLVTSLLLQYQSLGIETPKSINQINSLSNANTFTITTAHQPSLFTGPLYYIYKIMSCIVTADHLNKQFPNYHFIPIFVSGGEDHDFEEINHLHLFNKTITWNTQQNGAVGRMHINDLQTTITQLSKIIGSSDIALEINGLINKCYQTNNSYSQATFHFVHELFADFGLVFLDMDTPQLKAAFKDIIHDEINHQRSQKIMKNASKKLKQAGFSAQAYPREINLFYLDENGRNRIEKTKDNNYKILNTEIEFTYDELKHTINHNPEKFSPNVILRPLYQERILPNLAYIGGGGEIAYWLERKDQFAHYSINFPMLLRRHSVMWVDKSVNKIINKLGLSPREILKNKEKLKKQYIKKYSHKELDLKHYNKKFDLYYEEIVKLTNSIDPTLEASVASMQKNQEKALQNLESKLIKAEKRKFNNQLNKIDKIYDKLFPNNNLQERHTNFLELYLKHGNKLFQTLHENLTPFDKRFVIISEK